jgi:hypothetical protein
LVTEDVPHDLAVAVIFRARVGWPSLGDLDDQTQSVDLIRPSQPIVDGASWRAWWSYLLWIRSALPAERPTLAWLLESMLGGDRLDVRDEAQWRRLEAAKALARVPLWRLELTPGRPAGGARPDPLRPLLIEVFAADDLFVHRAGPQHWVVSLASRTTPGAMEAALAT